MTANKKPNGKKQRRVSFAANKKQKSDEVEQKEIDVNIFDTQKFIEDSLILEFDKRKSQGRMSLNPLDNIALIEDEVKEQVVENSVTVYKEKSKKNSPIDDFMYNYEIRFLDKIITQSNNKSSFSSQKSDPRDALWTKYSLKPRMEFFKNLSKYLKSEMCKLQQKIDTKQKSINMDKIKTDGLKKQRNESRNRSKLEWYTYRRVQELNYNKVIVENEQKLRVENANKAEELERLRMEVEKLRNNKINMHNEVNSLNESLKEFNAPNTDDLEDLKYKLIEKVTRTEELKEIEDDLNKKMFEKDTQCRIVKNRIKELKCECSRLDSEITGKNADETQIFDLQNKCRIYEDIFNVKLINAIKNKITLEICGFEFTFYLGVGTTVTNFTVKKTNRDVLYNTHIFDMFFIENMLEPLKHKEIQTNSDISYVEKTLLLERQKRVSISDNNSAAKDEISNMLNINNTMDIFMREKVNNNNTKTLNAVSDIELSQPKRLRCLIHKILHKYHKLSMLIKEINLLSDKCKIETIYAKNKIYLRLYLKTIDIKLNTLDLSMDRDMLLYCDKNVISDLNNKQQGITQYVHDIVQSLK